MGFHYYTFNQVVDTWKWEREKREERDRSVPYEEAVTR
jgi:hypothetical protein